MKAASFVPVIGAISPDMVEEVPGLADAVAFWTRGRPAAEWFREMEDCWGTAGFVARRADEVQGFVVYGPPERFPQAGAYPVGPLTDAAAMLAYVGGDVRTRRRLLVRMLRELRLRGVGTVEAVASDRERPHHVPTAFMLQSGWRPVRHAPHGLGRYTLVRTELGSAVEVGELARALVGKVRLPSLKRKVPNPGILARADEHGEG
ncbi:MAG: hypothetical protein AVDCRST_MAG25-875 [uncultured Rubrobacteraceae bacterium]|uniref:N-acetyltransferase domain-containing protein n=1 Tax=uncultured Rubrobacteraceae bacterium TaxID=349277 RepID=A0A6J4R612_9ACTN|nr:MAG: hypothetical protein AVDCRST_MAG25-875 [uncultured Rubrobacteraceae bacterium]